jgi:aminopeptidase N
MHGTLKTKSKSLNFLLPSILLFASAIHAQVSQQTIAKPKPQPTPETKYIPPRSYDVKHIKLDLRFDWTSETVNGTATIAFAPLRSNLEEVELDATNMTFSSIKLAKGNFLRYSSDSSRQKLSIKLDKAYQPTDTLTVIIDYKTDGPSNAEVKPSFAGNGGLIFIKPAKNSPKNPRQIWSQGEAEFNHYWFPCFDHPNDFATTEMIATVEKPLMVISNGRLVQEKENEDNTRTFHWKMDQPHAVYLVSVVIGEFAVIEDRSKSGVPVITYIPKDKVAEARKTVARVPRMIDFFEDYTGVEFPFAKYGQVFAHGFSGGMENVTATTLDEKAILDERSMLDETSEDLLSHELAHTWFGNYVTCRTWSEIWLNESFATYFEFVWDERLLGHDEALYSDLRANHNQYFRDWTRGIRRPVVTKNYIDPDAVFDTYAYPRGAAVLHILRKMLGEDDWRRAINYYLKKHANQPVGTEEFRVAIEEATGQPLEWFFEQWVYKMGHPVFDVSQTYDAKTKTLKLKARQTQKPDAAFLYPQVAYFQTPVEIAIATNSGTRIERVFIESKEEQEFAFEVDTKPLFVSFDYESSLIKELNFQKPLDELIAQLEKDRDVLGRLWALQQLERRLPKATAPKERQEIIKAISAAVTKDVFWGIRRDAAKALNGLNNEMARAGLSAALKDQDSRVRSQAIESLSVIKDASLANTYLQFLDDQSYKVIEKAALALAMTKSQIAYNALTKLVQMSSWNERIKISALRAMAELNDKRALEVALKNAEDNNDEVREAAFDLIARVGKNDKETFDFLSKTLKSNFQTGDEATFDIALKALVTLGDKRAIPLFEELAKTAKTSEVKDEMKKNISRLRNKSHKP